MGVAPLSDVGEGIRSRNEVTRGCMCRSLPLGISLESHALRA